MARNHSHSSLQMVACLVWLSTLAGCAATPEPGDAGAGLPPPVTPGQGIDDLTLVDCLLPGQIRQLGTRMTYLAPRRSVKSTKSECGIRGGEFVLFDRSDYASALQTLLPKAQSGDPVAQNYVGEIYEKGLGLAAPDYAQAANWYRKAADANHAPAQTNLGSLYERGLGVPQDKAQALDWYRKSSGLTGDRLVFESTLKSQQEAFRQELAVRNQVAAGLRQQLRLASATRPSGAKPSQAKANVAQVNLQRQAESQRRDAESEAERVRKELHAVAQLKQSDGSASKPAQQGKLEMTRTEPSRAQPAKEEITKSEQYRAQLGKLELTRNEQYRALLDTSRLLAQQ